MGLFDLRLLEWDVVSLSLLGLGPHRYAHVRYRAGTGLLVLVLVLDVWGSCLLWMLGAAVWAAVVPAWHSAELWLFGLEIRGLGSGISRRLDRSVWAQCWCGHRCALSRGPVPLCCHAVCPPRTPTAVSHRPSCPLSVFWANFLEMRYVWDFGLRGFLDFVAISGLEFSAISKPSR